jgi:hypothetical protein
MSFHLSSHVILKDSTMSAPNQLMQDADTISYGFLAARTSNALRNLMAGNSLGSDDERVLEEATRFLQDISDGARFTASGNFREGANPSRSIAALDVAFGAIDLLKQLVSREKNVASFFEELAKAVSQAREAGVSPDVAGSVQSADQFFDALGTWLSNELHSHKPLLGTRRIY